MPNSQPHDAERDPNVGALRPGGDASRPRSASATPTIVAPGGAPPPRMQTVVMQAPRSADLAALAPTQEAPPGDTVRTSPQGTVQLSIEALIGLMRPLAKPAKKDSTPPTSASVAPPAAPRRTRVRFAARALAAVAAVGLLAYASVHGVLANDTRWVTPTLLSKSDPRVVQVATALQQETTRKSALVARINEIETRQRETARWIELEQSFQASFKAALRADLDGQRAELRRLQKLLADRQEAEAATPSAEDDAASAAVVQAKIENVKERVRMLDAVLRGGRSTYQSLALRREYDRSVAGVAQATEVQAVLTKALADAQAALAEKERLIASIESSPYRLAIDGDVTLGFVPYENATAASKGAPLVACRTSIFFCAPVGTIGDKVAGEVHGTHPFNGKELRGQLVRLSLDDPRAAELQVAFAGRGPFELD
jgi:hypothetical protein